MKKYIKILLVLIILVIKDRCFHLNRKNAYLLFSLPRELWNKVYNRTFLNTNKLDAGTIQW